MQQKDSTVTLVLDIICSPRLLSCLVEIVGCELLYECFDHILSLGRHDKRVNSPYVGTRRVAVSNV